MEGFVFDIKKFALHDGPGIRTTVFLTGCPLRCWWCHNPESLRTTPSKLDDKSSCLADSIFTTIDYTAITLFDEIKKDYIFYEESDGGVTFSGGEPLMQIDFVEDVMKLCNINNISCIIDTSGYADYTAFERIYNLTDKFLFDIKLLDDADHIEYTGVSNKLIIDNLRRLCSIGKKVRIRVPLIPGITDTEKNLIQILDLVKSLKYVQGIDLLPYNKLSESKYERLNQQIKLGNLNTQSEAKLAEILEIFSSADMPVNFRG